MISIHDLLESAIQHRASDLILKAGAPPMMRVDGRVVPTQREAMTSEDTEALAESIIYTSSRDHLLRIRNPQARAEEADQLNAESMLARLREQEEIDLVFTIPDLVRVRANIYLQQATVATALRIIPLRPRSLDELNLPPVLRDLVARPQGLILVTGPTGSGKSTTLAGLIQQINSTRAANVVTIEDPIEYVFEDKMSMIQQREIGQDTRSFGAALRSVLRQSPDVIMVGEMRDPATIEVALTAAEVGHLVLSTLHTSGAPQTVDRIMNSFPTEKRQQIAAQIAGGLLCVASQRLVPRASGVGRVPAVEVMTGSPTVKRQIETGDIGTLAESIREGAHFGMQSFNMSLAFLADRGVISADTAIANSPDQAELRPMLRRG
ncbi:MAG TPA: PilT/PilU family type 4a pilus ATPase [Armatimonadota bacterium]